MDLVPEFGYFAGVRSTFRYSTSDQTSSFVSLLLKAGMSVV